MRLTYEAVLNKDVQAPPTEATLAARLRSGKIEERLFKAFLAVWIISILGWALLCMDKGTENYAGYGLLDIVAGLIIGVILAPNPRDVRDCSPLPKSACRSALETFKETPEGLIYLGKLREQSRQVTWFDVNAAGSWAATVKRLADEELSAEQAASQKEQEEEACRELHGISA